MNGRRQQSAEVRERLLQQRERARVAYYELSAVHNGCHKKHHDLRVALRRLQNCCARVGHNHIVAYKHKVHSNSLRIRWEGVPLKSVFECATCFATCPIGQTNSDFQDLCPPVASDDQLPELTRTV